MSDLHAEPLSPLDAATLWPQLRRLAVEVLATRSGERLLVASSLAAMAPALPRLPRTAVLGVRRGLNYRGVVVARELSGGAAWEIVSLRLAKGPDEQTVTALLADAAAEIARRGGRTAFLRHYCDSPHTAAIRRGGFLPYDEEHCYAVPPGPAPHELHGFHPPGRADRSGIFRLYCRAVPATVRMNEAPTQLEWRALIDSYDFDRELVLLGETAAGAWACFGDREARVLEDGSIAGAPEALLDAVQAHAGRHGTLVLRRHQESLAWRAEERGYAPLTSRAVCARRMAALNSLKEAVPVAAESVALPQ